MYWVLRKENSLVIRNSIDLLHKIKLLYEAQKFLDRFTFRSDLSLRDGLRSDGLTGSLFSKLVLAFI